MAISWAELWVRLKPAPSDLDIGRVMLHSMETALAADDAEPLKEILDKKYGRSEWSANLRKTLAKVVREIAEMPSRGAQARVCRHQLLDRIAGNVSSAAVLELDRDLRQKWLTFKLKDAPFNEEKQLNELLIKLAFGKLALAAIEGLYVSQYNGTLDIQTFLTPYRMVFAALMDFKVRTFHILSGNSAFGHQAATVYDQLGVDANGARLSEAQMSLADAIEKGNKNEIEAAQVDAATAIRECRASLDKFNVVTRKRGAPV